MSKSGHYFMRLDQDMALGLPVALGLSELLGWSVLVGDVQDLYVHIELLVQVYQEYKMFSKHRATMTFNTYIIRKHLIHQFEWQI